MNSTQAHSQWHLLSHLYIKSITYIYILYIVWFVHTDRWGVATGGQSRSHVRSHRPVPHSYIHAASTHLQHTHGWRSTWQEGHLQTVQLHHRKYAVRRSLWYLQTACVILQSWTLREWHTDVFMDLSLFSFSVTSCSLWSLWPERRLWVCWWI